MNENSELLNHGDELSFRSISNHFKEYKDKKSVVSNLNGKDYTASAEKGFIILRKNGQDDSEMDTLGWKFHITVADLTESWDIVKDVLIKHGVNVFKLVSPASLSKNNLVGRYITIYPSCENPPRDFVNDDNNRKSWQTIFTEITVKLDEIKAKPSVIAPDKSNMGRGSIERPVKGTPYVSYRNDDGLYSYTKDHKSRYIGLDRYFLDPEDGPSSIQVNTGLDLLPRPEHNEIQPKKPENYNPGQNSKECSDHYELISNEMDALQEVLPNDHESETRLNTINSAIQNDKNENRYGDLDVEAMMKQWSEFQNNNDINPNDKIEPEQKLENDKLQHGDNKKENFISKLFKRYKSNQDHKNDSNNNNVESHLNAQPIKSSYSKTTIFTQKQNVNQNNNTILSSKYDDDVESNSDDDNFDYIESDNPLYGYSNNPLYSRYQQPQPQETLNSSSMNNGNRQAPNRPLPQLPSNNNNNVSNNNNNNSGNDFDDVLDTDYNSSNARQQVKQEPNRPLPPLPLQSSNANNANEQQQALQQPLNNNPPDDQQALKHNLKK